MARENVICFNEMCKWNGRNIYHLAKNENIGSFVCNALYIEVDTNGVCVGGTNDRYKKVKK